ncbi:hypothetical protein E0H78_13780 [Acinetobacter sp. ANC 4641]|nr:hypothetical protein E0H78_13780 [Acinetobacter sp. ANC 4641]
MQQAWRNSWAQPSASNAYFTTPENACAALNASIGFPTSNFIGSGTYVSSTQFRCNFTSGSGSVFLEDNPSYSSSAVPATSSITLPQLVQLLIDQMGNNSAAIKNVLDQLLETAIAQAQTATNIDADLKAMLGALTAALDNAATYAGSGTANGTQTTTATGANLKLDFPVFCGWAGIVCEAAQTAINFPTTVSEWWKTVVEWNKTLVDWWGTLTSWHESAVKAVSDAFTEIHDYVFEDYKPEKSDDTVDPQTIDPTIPSTPNFSFGSNQCPPDLDVPINFSRINKTISISFEYPCQLADSFYYIVIAMSGYIGALIIAGKRDT